MRRLAALAAAALAIGGCDTPGFRDDPGREATVEGRVAAIPHAHLVHPPAGKKVEYVDLEPASGGGQVVVYAAARLPRGARLRLTGTVLLIEGTSKGETGRKFTETQIDVARWEYADPNAAAVEALVDALGRPDVPLERKREVKREIVRAGKPAIPVLIAHLDDARVYEKGRDVQNYYALPPHLPPPKPIYADAQVGSECRELLHDIITPAVPPPPGPPIKPASWQILDVGDWDAWWRRNEEKTLDEIHAVLEPAVDAYWRSGGVTQRAP